MPDPAKQLDDSGSPDLETIFHAEGTSTAEVEALSIKSLLESNGIAAVMVGDSVLPNLPFELKVARDQAARARQLIAGPEHEPGRFRIGGTGVRAGPGNLKPSNCRASDQAIDYEV